MIHFEKNVYNDCTVIWFYVYIMVHHRASAITYMEHATTKIYYHHHHHPYHHHHPRNDFCKTWFHEGGQSRSSRTYCGPQVWSRDTLRPQNSSAMRPDRIELRK